MLGKLLLLHSRSITLSKAKTGLTLRINDLQFISDNHVRVMSECVMKQMEAVCFCVCLNSERQDVGTEEMY